MLLRVGRENKRRILDFKKTQRGELEGKENI